MFKAGDVRIENVPDAHIIEPTDAVITVTRACICGSDLWPYQKMEHSDTGRVMGHEAIGVVEAVGAMFTPSKRVISSSCRSRFPMAPANSVTSIFRRHASTAGSSAQPRSLGAG
jgi:threonine dehydrogenase-like Zn-dependent dehydrogenase